MDRDDRGRRGAARGWARGDKCRQGAALGWRQEDKSEARGTFTGTDAMLGKAMLGSVETRSGAGVAP